MFIRHTKYIVYGNPYKWYFPKGNPIVKATKMILFLLDLK